MTWTYVSGAIKHGQEMLAGSGDDHWTLRHEQQRSLQPETGVESTECFKKASKPVFFFFSWGEDWFLRRLPCSPPTWVQLHAEGDADWQNRMPCISTVSESLDSGPLSNASIRGYFWMLHVEDKLLCDSHIVAGHLTADNFSVCFCGKWGEGRKRFERLCFYRIIKLQIHCWLFLF